MVVDFLARGSAEKFDIEHDEGEGEELWYERECVSISAALIVKCREMGVEAQMLVGAIIGPKRSFRPHAWVEFGDGSWLDPTSAQVGFPEALILMPGDNRRNSYWPVLDEDRERALADVEGYGVLYERQNVRGLENAIDEYVRGEEER